MVPLQYEGQQTRMYGFYFGYDQATFGVKLKNAWYSCMEFARMVWMSLRELVSGNVGVKDLSGPVGIVDMMAETGQQAASVADALYSIFYFGAFIAVNLAVMNMLPIPALDGGRVFLLLVTWSSARTRSMETMLPSVRSPTIFVVEPPMSIPKITSM